jgi:hypothetical protein
MPSALPHCADCAHHRRAGSFPLSYPTCATWRENLCAGVKEIVTGEHEHWDCTTARYDERLCGLGARFFAPHPALTRRADARHPLPPAGEGRGEGSEQGEGGAMSDAALRSALWVALVGDAGAFLFLMLT